MGTKGVTSKKVLIVEDNHDTSFLLCQMLQRAGFEVEHAIDGVVGYKTASQGHPDLIVTDLQMPRMDGIEMIKRIRQERELSGTRIIAMTAYGPRALNDALQAGADEIIQKPIDYDQFLMTVKSALSLA